MRRRIAKLKITRTRSQTIEARPYRVRARCPVCKREVEMLTSLEAAGVLEVDGRTFDHFVADGRIHAVQTVSGSLRVCKESLFTRWQGSGEGDARGSSLSPKGERSAG